MWGESARGAVAIQGREGVDDFVCARVLSIKLNARRFLNFDCVSCLPTLPLLTLRLLRSGIYLQSHAMTILDCHGHARSATEMWRHILRAFLAKWNCICALRIKFNYFLTCSAILCVPQICLCQFVACFGASLERHFEKCLNICRRTSARAEYDDVGRYICMLYY